MPLIAVCPEGHKLQVKDEHAGKKIRCPKCGGVALVPAAPATPGSTQKRAAASAQPAAKLKSTPITEAGSSSTRSTPPRAQESQPKQSFPKKPVSEIPASKPAANRKPGKGAESYSPPEGPGNSWDYDDDLSHFNDSASSDDDDAYSPENDELDDEADEDPWTTPKASSRPVASSLPSPPLASTSSRNMWLTVAGGIVAALLLLTAVAWLLPPQTKSGTVTATSAVSSSPPTTIIVGGNGDVGEAANVPPASHAAESVDQGAATNAAAADVTPAGKGKWDLAPVRTNKKLNAFQTPFTAQSSAYDEITGRLLVATTQKELIAMDMDDVIAGNLTPEKIITTNQIPVSICWKPFGNDRLFALVFEGDEPLTLFHADGLERAGQISLPGLSNIRCLQGNSNPNDPWLYFVGDNARSSAQIGRINLETLTLESLSQQINQRILSLKPSADGNLLFVEFVEGGFTSYIWSTLKDKNGDSVLFIVGGHGGANYAGVQPFPDGHLVLTGDRVCGPLMRGVLGNTEFAPCDIFESMPLMAGVNIGGLVLASANNYSLLSTVAFPQQWLTTEQPSSTAPRKICFPVLDVVADDTRKAVIGVLKSGVFLTSLQAHNLPSEPSLLPAQLLPSQLFVGRPFEANLSIEDKTATVEFIDDPPQPQGRSTTPAALQFSARPITDVLAKTPLGAAVNNQQQVIIPAKIEAFKSQRIPFTIRIDDEKMKVIGIDDFKEVLSVERTNGQNHSVTSPILILTDKPQQSKTVMPVIQGHTIQWTPSLDLVGRHLVRIRVTSGKIQHEFYWDFEIALPTHELPFDVAGIQPDVDAQFAVIWGRTKQQTSGSVIGILDLQKKVLVQHTDLPRTVISAAIDSSGVYACVADSAKGASAQLISLDRATLKVQEQVAIKTAFSSLRIIAGKYLYASSSPYDPGQSFDLPRLTPIEHQISPFPIAGEVGDGWIWDGILWDQAMKDPQLLLVPYPWLGNERRDANRTAPFGERIVLNTTGCETCLLPGQGQPDINGVPFLKTQGGLTLEQNKLVVRSQGNADKAGTAFTLCPPDFSKNYADYREVSESEQSYLAASKDEVLIVRNSKLTTIPLNLLVQEETPFRITPVQTMFSEKYGDKLRLKYSATDAATYHLHLQHAWSNVFNDPPLVELISQTGEFELDPDPNKRLPIKVLEMPVMVQLQNKAGQSQSDRIAALKKIEQELTPYFRQVAGRNPKGIPVPVYITVVATHTDGFQRAALSHAVLIEIPYNAIP